MAKSLMVLGTMSNVGKSYLTAGLCRIFKQDGYSVAPFKAQNMALNSGITSEGLEMGRAQMMQAEACGIAPDVRMNPILLKPTSDVGSQVIVNGKVVENLRAVEYYARKKQWIPEIQKSYDSLAEKFDIVVLEGAGSPAEINLKQDDIVNMNMAKMADAPALLVGDIDCGGVFAQLVGTVQLLEPEERQRVKGLLINKFRGDVSILEPGLRQLEEIIGIPVLGVIPYMHLDIDEEDSLSHRMQKYRAGNNPVALLQIAVIRFPHISNFTDFMPLETEESVDLYYVRDLQELGNPDAVILPGTKNTMGDLQWMRQNGLEARIKQLAEKGIPVYGICGGYQMMGCRLDDPFGVENGGSMRGMELFPQETVFEENKRTTRISGTTWHKEFTDATLPVEGYEIHMGKTANKDSAENDGHPFLQLEDHADGWARHPHWGTYLHGIFDSDDFRRDFLRKMACKKGIASEAVVSRDWNAYREQQYDLLAEGIRKHVNLEKIYEIMGIGPEKR